MELSSEATDSVARWVVATLDAGRARTLDPAEVASDLAGSYGDDAPVGIDTLTPLLLAGESLADECPDVRLPRLRHDIAWKLMRAICRRHDRDFDGACREIGIASRAAAADGEAVERPERSSAFALIMSLLDGHAIQAEGALACGIEAPAIAGTSLEHGRALVLALRTGSVPMFAMMSEALGRHGRSYVTIMVLYDSADMPRGEMASHAQDYLGAFAVAEQAISVSPLGSFLYEKLNPEAGCRQLAEQFKAIGGKEGAIDPFDDRNWIEIESTITTNGPDAGTAIFGDHLHEQLSRLLAMPTPVRCMVRGCFGAGKSSALFRTAAALMPPMSADEADDLSYEAFLQRPRPLILPASETLSEANVPDRLAAALRRWYNLSNSFAAAPELVRCGAIVVFIDGLDESPALSQGDRIARMLQALPGYFPDAHGIGSAIADRSKFVISYRPEIFQTGDQEDNLLNINTSVNPALQDYTYVLTVRAPRKGLRSPFDADVATEAIRTDPRSAVGIADGLFRSIGRSALFRALAQPSRADAGMAALQFSASKFARREGAHPHFLRELYLCIADLAERWAVREQKRDVLRRLNMDDKAADRRLDQCTRIALAMLGRQDCSIAAPDGCDKTGLGVTYALPIIDLRRIIDQSLLTADRASDPAWQGMHQEEIQLLAAYDMRVGMMLIVDEDPATDDRGGRWRFPNAAMEACFLARGLYKMLEQLLAGNIDRSAIDYPFDAASPLGPLCRTLIGDRLRGAVLVLAGKIMATKGDQASRFVDDVLRKLCSASRPGDPDQSLAICIAEHPVLALNLATLCLWLHELFGLGNFHADLSGVSLSGLRLHGWNWVEGPPPVRRLTLDAAIVEETELDGFTVYGAPLLQTSRGGAARVRAVADLALFSDAEDDHDHDDPLSIRWSIIPGGVIDVPRFRANPDQLKHAGKGRRVAFDAAFVREGGRDMSQSIVHADESGQRMTKLFVPTFLMRQTPTSNAEFLTYLQTRPREGPGWPLYERRSTSNPWYLYDWSHIEFLFGSDLNQWPQKAVAADLRRLARDDFSDRAALRKVTRTWLRKRADRQATAQREVSARWSEPHDVTEKTGWLLSTTGPFQCDREDEILQLIDRGGEPLALLLSIFRLFENWLHRPVTRINWRVATEFARARGWSLPSEAEFEAAARWRASALADSAGEADRKADAPAELALGFHNGAELWRGIGAQLHAYLPNIRFTAPPWISDAVERPLMIATPPNEPIVDRHFVAVAKAYRAIRDEEGGLMEGTMPPAYLIGVVGTWTRDVYDPTWPLGLAHLPSDGPPVMFSPVNTGLIDTLRSETSMHEIPTPAVADLTEEPLRAVRGRGLRFGWPRDSNYRFGQQETNVNPDVGLRCVRRLHLAVNEGR